MQEEMPSNIQDSSVDQVEYDYITWKKNAPLYYDLAVTHILEWPSLTVQYLPCHDESEDGQIQYQKLILGTQSPESGGNFLCVAKTRLPTKKARESFRAKEFAISKPGDSFSKTAINCVELEAQILHPGEVLKARAKPNAFNVVATKSSNGNVYVFDYSKEPPVPAGDKLKAQMVLQGHSCEGWGLDWALEGHRLLSSDNSGGILLWDIEHPLGDKQAEGDLSRDNRDGRATAVLEPVRDFSFHSSAINDVKFHRYHPDVFACVAGHNLSIWDQRNATREPFFNILTHTKEAFSLDFSSSDEYLVLTGGSDGLIELWDMRNLGRALCDFRHGEEPVIKVEWSPTNESVFGSCGEDKRVNIWDCSRIDTEQGADQEKCLIFSHYGHQGVVNDFSWNPATSFGVASVDSSNMVQVWEMDERFYYDN